MEDGVGGGGSQCLSQEGFHSKKTFTEGKEREREEKKEKKKKKRETDRRREIQEETKAPFHGF
ncbi:hypothetical protein EYF80_064508 [Liparis tanakae]|uniref:Uncharacterized protein n=1 Tax=Liparis tanakae TaxID=230148 RepID=A0A4Z2EA10_9TELE|nr:hypothetical protein EYF80_064508 [Liparis tanakae]